MAVVVAAGVFMGLEAFSGGSGASQSPNAAAAAPGAGNAAPNGNPNGFARPGGYTVASVDGSTIGVDDPGGVVHKVTTNGETRIMSNDVVTLGALKVGDHVRVVGTGTGTAVTADRITDSGDRASTGGFPGRGFRNRQGNGQGNGRGNGQGNGTVDGDSSAATPPGGGQVPPDAVPGNGSTPGNDTGRAFVSGTIASIDGSTVTITLTPDSGMTSSGTSTATVSDATVITKSMPIKVSDLNDGDRIVVFGTTSGSTLAATDVIRGDIRPGAARSPGR